MNALDKAISLVGSQSKLADSIGGTPQLVNNWVRRGGYVPEEHCPDIERSLSGAVTCEDLRPDIAWVRIPDKTWPHPKGRPLVDHARRAA